MSHSRYIGVLAHHEASGAKPQSFIPATEADTLVRNMVAEKISQRVIRMFEPSSVFLTIHRDIPIQIFSDKPFRTSVAIKYLAPAEIPGLKFEQPESQRARHPARASYVRREWEQWKTELAQSGSTAVGKESCVTTSADVLAGRSSSKLQCMQQIPTSGRNQA